MLEITKEKKDGPYRKAFLGHVTLIGEQLEKYKNFERFNKPGRDLE